MDSKLLIVAGVVLLAGWFWFGRGGSSANRVTSQRAHELVGQGARLVDVRTAAEFGSGHVAGAVNLPVQSLSGRLAELGAKDQPVVVYCRSGHRSQMAAQTLKAAGFSAIYDLGPMTAW